MAKLKNITVGVHVEYRIVFFPFATYVRLGDLAVLKVLGIPVYERLGDLQSFCGVIRNAS